MRIELRDSRNRLYGVFLAEENVIEIKRDKVIAQFDLRLLSTVEGGRLRPRAVFIPASEHEKCQDRAQEGSGGDPAKE